MFHSNLELSAGSGTHSPGARRLLGRPINRLAAQIAKLLQQDSLRRRLVADTGDQQEGTYWGNAKKKKFGLKYLANKIAPRDALIGSWQKKEAAVDAAEDNASQNSNSSITSIRTAGSVTTQNAIAGQADRDVQVVQLAGDENQVEAPPDNDKALIGKEMFWKGFAVTSTAGGLAGLVAAFSHGAENAPLTMGFGITSIIFVYLSIMLLLAANSNRGPKGLFMGGGIVATIVMTSSIGLIAGSSSGDLLSWQDVDGIINVEGNALVGSWIGLVAIAGVMAILFPLWQMSTKGAVNSTQMITMYAGATALCLGLPRMVDAYTPDIEGVDTAAYGEVFLLLVTFAFIMVLMNKKSPFKDPIVSNVVGVGICSLVTSVGLLSVGNIEFDAAVGCGGGLFALSGFFFLMMIAIVKMQITAGTGQTEAKALGAVFFVGFGLAGASMAGALQVTELIPLEPGSIVLAYSFCLVCLGIGVFLKFGGKCGANGKSIFPGM